MPSFRKLLDWLAKEEGDPGSDAPSFPEGIRRAKELPAAASRVSGLFSFLPPGQADLGAGMAAPVRWGMRAEAAMPGPPAGPPAGLPARPPAEVPAGPQAEVRAAPPAPTPPYPGENYVMEGDLPPEPEYLRAEASTDGGTGYTTGPSLMDLGWTFRLQSNPTASKTIYLDFDGHTTSGTSWNTSAMGSSFYSPAYDIDGNPSAFSTAELTRIQQIWQRVAEDFAPFDVNVTTQAPPDDWLARSGSTDPYYGVRAVITSYGPSSGSAGGIAFVGSFTSSVDTPVFVYNTSITGVAEAISHEVGHSLGLAHDGTASTGYYTGHGSGETSWAPIMGGSYNRNVTTWDDGTYSGSTNTGSTGNYGRGADDVAVIVGNNGFGYRPDLVGNTLASAAPLTISGGAVAQFGTIETRFDTDWFSFQLLDVGDLDLSFDPYWYRAYVDADGLWGGSTSTYLARTSDILSTTPYPENAANLDLAVDLYDSSGVLLYRADSPGLATSISLQGLAAATYYLKLDGVGFGDPTASTPTGYTDVASIGDYWISGTITQAADNAGGGSTASGGGGTTATTLPRLSIADIIQAEGTGSSATTFLVQVVLDAAAGSEITVDYRTGDDTALSSGSGADYAATSGTLRIGAGATTATIAISVIADSTVEADESFLVSLSNVTGATLATSQARVTIANDDITSTSGGGKGPKRQAKGKVATATDPLTGLALDGDSAWAAARVAEQIPDLGTGPLDEGREAGELPDALPSVIQEPFPTSVVPPLPMSEALFPAGLEPLSLQVAAAPWLASF